VSDLTCSRRRGVGHGFGGLPREILRPRGQGRSGAGARDISDRQSCSRRSRPESSNENHRPCRGGPKDATGRRRRNGNFVAAPNDRVPRCPSRTTGVTSVKGAPKAAEGSPRTGSPCRGTGSSNPVPSRGESANSRSLPRPKTRVQSSSPRKSFVDPAQRGSNPSALTRALSAVVPTPFHLPCKPVRRVAAARVRRRGTAAPTARS